MQFTLVALLIGAVAASPAALLARLATRDSDPCSGTLYGISQCCSADVLGVADRDCSTPKSATSTEDLKQSCVAVSKGAHCCTLGLAGLGLVCKVVE